MEAGDGAAPRTRKPGQSAHAESTQGGLSLIPSNKLPTVNPRAEFQARKRHININFLVRLLLGRPRECPWDKPMFSPYFTQWKPSLSLGQTHFVPGILSLGQSWGRRAAQKVYVLKVYVPFSLARVLFLGVQSFGLMPRYPVFARVVGELRAADPSNVHGPAKQNASPKAQSEAPRRGWKPGLEQHPETENRDAQHMLEQPRGSCPEGSQALQCLAKFIWLWFWQA